MKKKSVKPKQKRTKGKEQKNADLKSSPLRSARTLGAPVGAAAAVATKKIDVAAGANFLQHRPTNPLTHDVANALTHHATDNGGVEVVAAAGAAGAAVLAGASTATGGAAAAGAGAVGAGAVGAGAVGAGTATAGAAGAAAAGTAAAGTGASAAGAGAAAAAQGQIVQAAAIGTVTVAAIATVVVVVANTGDEPEVAEPAPTTTTTVVAAPVIAQPTPGPGVFETASAAALDGNLMAGVDQDTEAGPLMVAGLQGSPTNVGVPITLQSGATLTVDPLGAFQYTPGESFVGLAAGETIIDEFAYVVTNATGFTEEWSASVTVTGENDAPAIADVAAVSLDEEATSSVAINATDPDGDVLSISLDDGAPSFVSLVDAADGTAQLTIAPGAGTAGAHNVGVTVTDGAEPPLTASATVAITVAAPAPELARVAENLVARYNFAETDGTTIADSAGAAPALTVADPDAVIWNGGSLTVTAPTLISSSGPASAITDAIKASNEFTVEAWVTPENTTQAGPARIVSISSGIGERNVTLAQGEPAADGADRWTSRQRSTETTINGLPALATPAGSAVAGARTHLAVTRSSSGEVQYYVDGTVVATGTAAGDLSNWESSFQLLLANETSLDRPWLGTLHLVAIYDRALSADEVGQNLQVGP